jgi:hypothetical protein
VPVQYSSRAAIISAILIAAVSINFSRILADSRSSEDVSHLNEAFTLFECRYAIPGVKKIYVVQLFTEKGTIFKEIEAGGIVEAIHAFIRLVGYRNGETISITER